MINKFIQRQLFSRLNQFKFSSDHHAPAPQKLQKVNQTLIYLYIKNIDNVYEKVPAFEGESILQTITRMGVRGFESNVCNGYDATYRPHVRPHDPFSDGPQCGGCRIVLEDNWYNRVNQQTGDISEQQKHILNEYQTDLQSNTRLACCLPVEKWMNGMSLSIDPQPTEGSLSQLF